MWIVVTVAIGVAGLVIGRRWVLLLPLVFWPLYFLGLAEEWWGSGLGDGWQFGFAIVVAAGVVAAALGVVLRPLVLTRGGQTAPR